jgi:hypothetical protein
MMKIYPEMSQKEFFTTLYSRPEKLWFAWYPVFGYYVKNGYGDHGWIFGRFVLYSHCMQPLEDEKWEYTVLSWKKLKKRVFNASK